MCALSDKVVIVTGGSSGIGRAAALSLGDRGAKVVITGRRAVPLEEMATQHPNIVSLVADAATPGDTVRTIAKAVDARASASWRACQRRHSGADRSWRVDRDDGAFSGRG
jgi:NAD(P)-dependent dehydrogenase (short-subunit alcohol dehydrogenase family)